MGDGGDYFVVDWFVFESVVQVYQVQVVVIVIDLFGGYCYWIVGEDCGVFYQVLVQMYVGVVF